MAFRRYFINQVVAYLPPTRAYALKAKLWRFAGVDISPDARIVSSVQIWTSGLVSIGADTFIGHETMIVGGGAAVQIGDRCDIAPRVLFVTGTHLDGNLERAAGPGISLPIEVGDGAWIGAGSTILGGVKIGDGAIVGAGSLVNSNVAAQTVVAGIPCRFIKNREY